MNYSRKIPQRTLFFVTLGQELWGQMGILYNPGGQYDTIRAWFALDVYISWGRKSAFIGREVDLYSRRPQKRYTILLRETEGADTRNMIYHKHGARENLIWIKWQRIKIRRVHSLWYVLSTVLSGSRPTSNHTDVQEMVQDYWCPNKAYHGEFPLQGFMERGNAARESKMRFTSFRLTGLFLPFQIEEIV